MKEEVLGFDDSFKLTYRVLEVYAKNERKSNMYGQQKDSSVELFLLNFWVKELTLRDLADRISMATRGTQSNMIIAN